MLFSFEMFSCYMYIYIYIYWEGIGGPWRTFGTPGGSLRALGALLGSSWGSSGCTEGSLGALGGVSGEPWTDLGGTFGTMHIKIQNILFRF